MNSVFDEAIVIAVGLSPRGIFRKSTEETLETYKKTMTWTNEPSCDLILNDYAIRIDKKQLER